MSAFNTNFSCSRLSGRFVLVTQCITLLLIINTGSISLAKIFTRVTDGALLDDTGASAIGIWWDFNNDQQLDLFIANWSGQNNFLYKNTSGTFSKITSGNIVEDGGNSYDASIGDFDNDGDADLFVANGIGSENFLYINNGDSTFTRLTSQEIVTDANYSLGCSWGDFDNDGYLDIFVSNFNEHNALYKNNGDGTFSRINSGEIVSDGGASSGAGWCDFDNDGDLDLFVGNLGHSNFLYRNNGNSTFTRIAEGPVVTDDGFSAGGSWGDCDNDGDFDLFVTNSGGTRNFFYWNNGDGSFTEDTLIIMAQEGGKSLSSSWGDLDNDGDLDLAVANYDNENNFLYLNNGDGSFLKIEGTTFTTDGGNSRGCSWGDLDNDGDLDLIIANYNQENYLYLNNGSANYWINITCEGTRSNRAAIGTKLRVKAMINGKPTWQLREISGQTGNRSQNSLAAEFGLGKAAFIDSLKIEWSSGLTEIFTNIKANQFIHYTEPADPNQIEKSDRLLAADFQLQQNYPNPFNPSTTIAFRIHRSGNVSLKIFNVLGEEIATLISGHLPAGDHRYQWNASGYAAGVYYYQVTSGEYSEVKKMVLIK